MVPNAPWLPPRNVWDSYRLRLLSYAIGTTEFLSNACVNARKALNFRSEPDHDPTAFNGKVCIVTGANAGIGLATTSELVARGAHVVMACRSLEKGKAALKAISAVPPYPGCNKGCVELLDLDLSSLNSVRDFIDTFKSKQLHLDLLICNAGIMAPLECLRTKDGIETQFQVNYLGHWLIAHELVIHQRQMRKLASKPTNKLSQGQGTRVVFLSSVAHIAGTMEFGANGDLNLTDFYSGYGAYANSKLAAVQAAKEFQRRFDRNERMGGLEDVAVSVHPGLIDTSLIHNWIQRGDVLGRLLVPIVNLIMRPLSKWILLPAEFGVRTVMYAATAPPQQVRGAYVAYGRATRPSNLACDAAMAVKLWTASCKLTGVTRSSSLE